MQDIYLQSENNKLWTNSCLVEMVNLKIVKNFDEIFNSLNFLCVINNTMIECDRINSNRHFHIVAHIWRQ